MTDKKPSEIPLNYIQCNLSAPKGQTNNFGKYKYRSCEDILEALKPHLAATECHVLLSDDIIAVEGRVYVKATAYLVRSEGQETVAQNTAFAREPLNKKGMDDSQITGTASSYARKYALNGLFLIDDNKDPDSNEHGKQQAEANPRVPHEEHIKTQFEAMANATTLGRLKTLSRSAYDYYKQWNEPDYCKLITEHNAKCAAKLEGLA